MLNRLHGEHIRGLPPLSQIDLEFSCRNIATVGSWCSYSPVSVHLDSSQSSPSQSLPPFDAGGLLQ